MVGIVIGAAVDALIAGSAVGLFLFCIRPQLQWRRASPLASILAGAVAVSVPVGLVFARFVAIPSIAFPGLVMLLLAAWFYPGALIRVTGGARPMAPDAEAVISRVTHVWDRFEVGDIEGAADEIGRLNSMRTPVTQRYIDLWQRYLAEEQARRSGTRESSRGTLSEIREEAARLISGGDREHTRRSWAVIGLAAIIGASPAIADARACIGVEQILRAAESGSASNEPLPVTGELVSEPEPGATLISDHVMDLEAAAESRHDPDTREQLVEAGFLTATSRDWLAADGRHIGADIFVFRDEAGALRFHRTVNRYACQFSNEAFEGPLRGIGLEVRWSRGDPILEQISWVNGDRRYIVSVSALSRPVDHLRVLRIADRAVEDMGG